MPQHDERPYRPKVRGRRVYDRDQLSFRKLSVRIRGAVRARGGARRARVATRAPGRLGRRVVVKGWYVRVDGSAASTRSVRLFLRYMEKEGASRGGEGGQLFGRGEPGHGIPGRDATNRVASTVPSVVRGEGEPKGIGAQDEAARDLSPLERALLEPLPGEKHQFRLVISPEDGHRLDLTRFTEELMEQVEKDVGQPLIWAAAAHYDTDDPHVHVVVRGVDREGRPLRFDREYISRIWRERAQELATRELGPRTELEYAQQLEREIRQGRLTSLDRIIAKRATGDVVLARDLDKHPRERLKFLGELGLANEVAPGEWRLCPGWQQTLRADGERGDIIKQMFKALRGHTSRYRVVRRGDALPKDLTEGSEVTGRVVSMGLIDSRPGEMYAILETGSGNGYYVPLRSSEIDPIRRGALVTLREQRGTWRRPLDAALVELAQQRGGVVDGESLRSALEGRLEALERLRMAVRQSDGTWNVQGIRASAEDSSSPSLDKLLMGEGGRTKVDVSALAADASRRLRELGELGLATRGPDVGTRLDSRTLDGLERLDRDQPRRKVVVQVQRLTLEQQVTYIGPTWLDAAKPRGGNAFATEILDACTRRRAYLKGQGIDVKDLSRRERSRVAAFHARELGRAVARRTAGFRGTVKQLYEAHSGHRYVIVVSGTEVLAVRAGPKTRGLVGREVEVSFSPAGARGGRKLKLDPVTVRARGTGGQQR